VCSVVGGFTARDGLGVVYEEAKFGGVGAILANCRLL